MEKVTITFTETYNDAERKEKLVDIISTGFYAYLKKAGYLKTSPGRKERVEKAIEENRRIYREGLE